jgi:hypothetical protein
VVDVAVIGLAGTATLTDAYTHLAPAAPPLSSLSPTSGPTSGCSVVRITGSGLAVATGVTFDGSAGTSFTVDSDTQITVTNPAGAAGAADVVVLSPNGGSSPGTFAYAAVPTVTSLTPTSGPIAGGTTVTITGTGFIDATSVRFDGVSGPFTIVDDTTITTTSPPHSAGAVDVTVANPGGTSNAGSFTYVAAPAISSLVPNTGPVAGGTVVTVTGTGFTGATGVTFDGAPGTSFTVDSDTQITVTTPAGTAGAADVVVASPNGDSTPGSFLYAAAAGPTIASIAPDAGSTAGGTSVTITGVGFSDATGVTFDGAAGTSFTVVDDTTITVTTPAGAAGTADVVVLSPSGDSASGVFTYLAVPTLSSLTPSSGPTAGGTSVTITGTGFTAGSTVSFGGTPAPTVTVNSATSITVVTPPHAAGAVDVTVTTPGGTSAPGAFTFIAAPVISSLSPTSGPVAGGTVVTITGTGFTGATGVTFGGTQGTSFSVDSDTQITVSTPGGAAGDVDVVVQSPNGDSAASTFMYVPAPTVSSLTPTTGPTAGGTTVTITGSGFTAGSTVSFGGTPAASVTVDSDTSITATTPAHAAGAVDVTVTTAGGTSAPSTFTYMTRPVITELLPDHGPGLLVIVGTGFTGATGVTFGGIVGDGFRVVDDTRIMVIAPDGPPPGPVEVVVHSPYGDSDAAIITYSGTVAPPTIGGISPSTGPAAGGTVVTITGSGFTGATGVTFDGVPGTGFTVVNDTTITVTSPPGTAGRADVVIQSPSGASAPGAFTYAAAAAGGGAGGGGLAVTGGDIGGIVLLALLALLPLTAGVALMRRSRRMPV